VKRTPFTGQACPIARTVDLLGDWWTPLVLRELYYGRRRFDDIQRRLEISRAVLTQRLNRLVDEGMLDRVPYQQRPVRHEYRLTDKGRSFFPVLAAIADWGTRWMPGDAALPRLRHTLCDTPLRAGITCSECARPVRLTDVRVDE
jgi:DNA-binding HxlR family transcriptional regulator